MSKYLEMQRKIRNMALGGEVTIVKPEDERLFSGSSTKATVYPPGPNPYTLRDEMGIAPSVALGPIKMQEGGTVPPADGVPLAPPPPPSESESFAAEVEAAASEVNDILQSEEGLDDATKLTLLKEARKDAEFVIRNKGDKSAILANLARRIESIKPVAEAPSLKAKAGPVKAGKTEDTEPKGKVTFSLGEATPIAPVAPTGTATAPVPAAPLPVVAPPPPAVVSTPETVVPTPAPTPAPVAVEAPPAAPETLPGAVSTVAAPAVLAPTTLKAAPSVYIRDVAIAAGASPELADKLAASVAADPNFMEAARVEQTPEGQAILEEGRAYASAVSQRAVAEKALMSTGSALRQQRDEALAAAGDQALTDQKKYREMIGRYEKALETSQAAFDRMIGARPSAISSLFGVIGAMGSGGVSFQDWFSKQKKDALDTQMDLMKENRGLLFEYMKMLGDPKEAYELASATIGNIYAAKLRSGARGLADAIDAAKVDEAAQKEIAKNSEAVQGFLDKKAGRLQAGINAQYDAAQENLDMIKKSLDVVSDRAKEQAALKLKRATPGTAKEPKEAVVQGSPVARARAGQVITKAEKDAILADPANKDLRPLTVQYYKPVQSGELTTLAPAGFMVARSEKTAEELQKANAAARSLQRLWDKKYELAKRLGFDAARFNTDLAAKEEMEKLDNLMIPELAILQATGIVSESEAKAKQAQIELTKFIDGPDRANAAYRTFRNGVSDSFFNKQAAFSIAGDEEAPAARAPAPADTPAPTPATFRVRRKSAPTVIKSITADQWRQLQVQPDAADYEVVP
jgi:hypothetical protein